MLTLQPHSSFSCSLLPRLAKYQAFKSFNKRIMVATDLFGRGMDIERVNIVFNYDMPENSDTYLHRVSSPQTPSGGILMFRLPVQLGHTLVTCRWRELAGLAPRA